MGVPAFFRYMSEKYPKIIEHLIEDRGTKDLHLPLPQHENDGYEFDNLYIDMNGIIHPCAHPEDRKAPSSETEMYQNVATYVDRLFAAVRPTKLLYLAIDGVAPRAKMNQQRSRRFRAAQDAAERNAIMGDIKEEMGIFDEEEKKSHGEWDSNVITPGTPFMHRLSDYIRSYILERINHGGPAWRRVTVIFSDASEPGEGEHKIMSYIREQRAMPGYNPNLRHILHGLDADLIMLGLATHEVNFTILREEVLFGRDQHSQSGSSKAQDNFDLLKGNGGMEALSPGVRWCYHKPLVMCRISVLREYLAVEFGSLSTQLPFTFDFERIVDDFVFLCFFVGNDFLPHLPTLDIRDGAVDFLFNVYKRVLPTLGDYLTRPGGEVNLEHVDVVLSEVGEIEDEVFQRRKGAEDAEKVRSIQRKARNKIGGNQAFDKHALVASGHAAAAVAVGKPEDKAAVAEDLNKNAAQNLKAALLSKKVETSDTIAEETANESKKEDDEKTEEVDEEEEEEEEEEELFDGTEGVTEAVVVRDNSETTAEVEARYKAKSQAMLDEYREKIEDEVRFWQAGWKERYYADKYKDRDITKGGGRQRVFKEYITGLCWVMKYYYAGCPSWKWYYPFHYAPFASDLRNVEQYKPEFDNVGPFRPIEQLMAVLPKESHQALPEACHELMLDPESPIADFYPPEVEIDPNGKAMPWLWVALLPFIDEERLLHHLNKVYPDFDEEAIDRNRFRTASVFVHKDHPWLGRIISDLQKSSPNGPGTAQANCKENGLAGSLIIPDASKEPHAYKCHVNVAGTPIPISQSFEQSPVTENEALSVSFVGPEVLPHKSDLLLGAVLPPPKLSIYDMNIRIPRINRGMNISDLGNGKNSQMNSFGKGGKGMFGHQAGRGIPSYQAQQQLNFPQISLPQTQGGYNNFNNFQSRGFQHKHPQNNEYPPQYNQYPPQNNQYPPQYNQYPPQNNQYPPQYNQYPPQNNQYPPQNNQYNYHGNTRALPNNSHFPDAKRMRPEGAQVFNNPGSAQQHQFSHPNRALSQPPASLSNLRMGLAQTLAKRGARPPPSGY